MKNSYDSYISSARRSALLILALGFVAFLMGLSEVKRQQRLQLFATVEKVLAAQQVVVKRKDQDTSDVSQVWWRLRDRLKKDPNAAAILRKSKEVPKLEINFRETTSADPRDECPMRILTFGPGENKAHVGFTKGRGQEANQDVPLQDIFLIAFDETCTLLGPYAAPIVIVQTGRPPPLEAGVALSKKALDDLLAIVPPPVKSRREFVPALGATEPEPADDLNDVLYVEYLKALVLRRAQLEARRPFTDVKKALDYLLAAEDIKLAFQGIPIPLPIAVFLLSIALFGLAFSLLHRLRRIPRRLAKRHEPWIMLHPKGWSERFAAIGWGVSLLAACALIAWAGYRYPLEAVILPRSIAKELPHATAALAILAVIFLLLPSLSHLLEINTGAGWIGWSKRIRSSVSHPRYP